MENKIYYGEYNLAHWIELILKKNIVLPPYQRNFVWKEEKVRKLIDTFNKKQFVPPITIGLFKTGTVTQNLILDGQQRLTSILLTYLNIMPDAAIFKAKKAEIADINEGDEKSEYGDNLDDILDWTFNRLIEKGHTKEDIISQITAGNYKKLEIDCTEKFFEDCYLGFSYVVPQCDDHNDQQKFYSSVFRNINIQGETLLPQESREALYYFNSDMPDFFKPNFCKSIKLKPSASSIEAPIDFVRYMSLLSQYSKDASENNLARGCRAKMEHYYEEYIYSVLGENQSAKFKKFDEIFPGKEYKTPLQKLSEAIKQLPLPKEGIFTSIIDMDVYFFGLIYQILFNKKQLDSERIEDLKTAINAKITEYKNDDYHKRSPNAFKYMRPRVNESITLYSNYVIAE